MKRFVLLSLLLFSIASGQAQKLSGQWTGGFGSGSLGRTEYVLELEIKGSRVSGYSYTYFTGYRKNYYVICRLSGSYDKGSKSLVVKEEAKVKSNTPPDFQDCLQIHTLTYLKGADKREVLVGKWKPARPQDDCGSGQTELERKQLVKVVPSAKTPAVAAKDSKSPVKPSSTTTPKTTPPPAAKATPPQKPTAPPVAKKSTPPVQTRPQPTVAENKPKPVDNTLPATEKPKAPSTSDPDNGKLGQRSKQVIRTIDVEEKTFRVDLYDNGQIDGDTISVFFNNKLVVSRQRLTTEPISINITIDENRSDNELVMFAENLGTIPPNTALMVLTISGKRYEVNITSSEQTSGTVRFKWSNSIIRIP
jgi:hypothetical protein